MNRQILHVNLHVRRFLRESIMPRKYEMSWDRHQARWTKMYKGQRFVVSCYALGVPSTKESSAEKANEWWLAKRAEIDGRSAKPVPGSPEAVTALLNAWMGQPP